jgi:hypothetical protein
MLRFDTWKTEPASVFFAHFVFSGMRRAIRIHDTFHPGIVPIPSIGALIIVITAEAAHTGSSTSTATLTLTVARQGVTSCKFAIAFRADMRTLSSV